MGQKHRGTECNVSEWRVDQGKQSEEWNLEEKGRQIEIK